MLEKWKNRVAIRVVKGGLGWLDGVYEGVAMMKKIE